MISLSLLTSESGGIATVEIFAIEVSCITPRTKLFSRFVNRRIQALRLSYLPQIFCGIAFTILAYLQYFVIFILMFTIANEFVG